MNQLKVNRQKFWSSVLLVLLLSATSVNAQSGRRQSRNRATVPTPAPPVVGEGKTTTNYNPLALAHPVKLLIGRDRTDKHFASEDAITASFIARLSEFQNLSCEPVGDLKRNALVKRAQQETETLSVLLQFDIDVYQSGTVVINSQDLEVKYFVFAPRSGKEMTKGKVFYQTIGGGRMRKSDWPGGTPIKITPEAAGVEAAELLHHWLLIREADK